MKLTVDADALAALSAPLRDAVSVAHEMQASTHDLAAHAEYAGHPALATAIGDFVHAWGNGLRGTAEHGESLARMCDLAAASYRDLDRRAGAQSGADLPGAAT